MARRDLQSQQENEAPSGRGRFFKLDIRLWHEVCESLGVAPAAAYLVIAQGTYGQSQLSRWSAKSIEKYTGLHSSRGKEAIQQLINRRFIERDQHSTTRRPRYKLLAFSEWWTAERQRRLDELDASSPWDSNYLRELEAAETAQPPGHDNLRKSQRESVGRLIDLKLAHSRDGWFRAGYPDYDETTPQLVWLPNALVQGASTEPSPVRLLRQLRDLNALRLLVTLYHAQKLSADGGISRSVVHGRFARTSLTERGHRTIWRFDAEQSYVYPIRSITEFLWQGSGESGTKGEPWRALQVLQRLGLLIRIPHLVENESPDAEIIHPLGSEGEGAEPLEIELADAAREAAEYLLGPAFLEMAGAGHEYLVPMYSTMSSVQMIAIYRLRYRPATGMTGDWYRRMKEDSQPWLDEYASMMGQQTPRKINNARFAS